MCLQNYYLKVIDFGEAKVVDCFDNESTLSKQKTRKRRTGERDSFSGSSDGASSFFGRIGKDKKTK